MTQPTSTNEQHRQEQEDDRNRRVVARWLAAGETSAQPPMEVDLSEKPSEQLETGERGEPGFIESESQIAVDTAVQILFLSSHKMWPFVWTGLSFATSSYQTERPHFKGKGGLAACGPPFSVFEVMSH